MNSTSSRTAESANTHAWKGKRRAAMMVQSSDKKEEEEKKGEAEGMYDKKEEDVE